MTSQWNGEGGAGGIAAPGQSGVNPVHHQAYFASLRKSPLKFQANWTVAEECCVQMIPRLAVLLCKQIFVPYLRTLHAADLLDKVTFDE